MKKVLLTLLLWVVPLSQSVAELEQYTDTFEVLKLQAPVRVVTEHLPPYQIAKQHRLVGGVNYQFVKRLFKRAGIDITIELMPWARAYKVAKEEKNAFIFSMIRNNEREDKFIWLAKLNNQDYAIYTHKDKKQLHIEDLENNFGLTSVAVRGTYEADLMQELGFVAGQNLVLVNSLVHVWAMMKQQRVDFTIAATQQNIGSYTEVMNATPSPKLAAPMYLGANLQTDSLLLEKLRSAYAFLVSQSDLDPRIEPEL